MGIRYQWHSSAAWKVDMWRLTRLWYYTVFKYLKLAEEFYRKHMKKLTILVMKFWLRYFYEVPSGHWVNKIGDDGVQQYFTFRRAVGTTVIHLAVLCLASRSLSITLLFTMDLFKVYTVIWDRLIYPRRKSVVFSLELITFTNPVDVLAMSTRFEFNFLKMCFLSLF